MPPRAYQKPQLYPQHFFYHPVPGYFISSPSPLPIGAQAPVPQWGLPPHMLADERYMQTKLKEILPTEQENTVSAPAPFR